MKTISLSDATREAIMLSLDTRVQHCAQQVATGRMVSRTQQGSECLSYWLGQSEKAKAAFIEFMQADRGQDAANYVAKYLAKDIGE